MSYQKLLGSLISALIRDFVVSFSSSCAVQIRVGSKSVSEVYEESLSWDRFDHVVWVGISSLSEFLRT